MRLSTALVLGATIAPTAFARQNGRHRNKDHVENFIKTEIPYAWERLFCNFGPDGCAAPGVNPGVVIASPSTDDPNCMFQSMLQWRGKGF